MFHSKNQRNCKNSLSLAAFRRCRFSHLKRIQSVFKDRFALSCSNYFGKMQSLLKILPYLKYKLPLQSNKGSLVLSLVASGAVAAAIVATHQLTQRFASGSVRGFNQQQAYVLAQRSLTVAGLMVNRNVILCSDSLVAQTGQAIGCRWKEPLSKDILAKKLYDSLKIDDSWFTNKKTSKAYAQNKLILKNPQRSSSSIFKNAEVTWTLRSFKDTNLRSISGALSKGYICRDVKTFAVREGLCDSRDDRYKDDELQSNRDSRLLEDKQCEDENQNPIAGSVCDYYADSDADDVIVFISVKVPYQATDTEEEKSKMLIANAAIRRPMSLVKVQIKQDSSMCAVSCTVAGRAHGDDSKIEYPECAGFASGNQNGGPYFVNNIHTTKTHLKVKNYGPGVLYNLQLLKEDIDPNTGVLLGKSMVGFSEDPLEPAHFTTRPADIKEGVASMEHHTPCYASSFYKPNLERIACDCEPNSDSDQTSNAVKTAGGTACKKGTSECASYPENNKDVFVINAPGVLQDSSTKFEARKSLSGCFHAPGKMSTLSALSNSILTVFEKPCKDAGTCQFNRINSDQPQVTQKKVTWCKNEYVGTSAANPTGRALRPAKSG